MSGYPLRLAIGAALAIVGIFIWSSFASKQKIVIHWAMIDQAEGANVMVDGEVVGQLKLFGQNPTTAFEIEDGQHEIRVEIPGLKSEPKTINTDAPGQSVDLWLEFEERYNPDGTITPMAVFR